MANEEPKLEGLYVIQKGETATVVEFTSEGIAHQIYPVEYVSEGEEKKPFLKAKLVPLPSRKNGRLSAVALQSQSEGESETAYELQFRNRLSGKNFYLVKDRVGKLGEQSLDRNKDQFLKTFEVFDQDVELGPDDQFTFGALKPARMDFSPIRPQSIQAFLDWENEVRQVIEGDWILENKYVVELYEDGNFRLIDKKSADDLDKSPQERLLANGKIKQTLYEPHQLDLCQSGRLGMNKTLPIGSQYSTRFMLDGSQQEILFPHTRVSVGEPVASRWGLEITQNRMGLSLQDHEGHVVTYELVKAGETRCNHVNSVRSAQRKYLHDRQDSYREQSDAQGVRARSAR